MCKVRLTLGLWFLVLLASCKTSDPVSSAASTGQGGAAAEDPCNLQKMDEETKKGVAKQIECVSSAIDAVGPGWLKLIKSAVETTQLVIEANSIEIEIEDEPAPAPNPSTPARERYKTTMKVWDVINKILEGATNGGKIQPRWLERCASNFTGTSKSLQSAASALESLTKTQSLNIDTMKTLVDSVGNATKAMFQLGQVLTTCTPGNDAKGVAQLNRFVKKMGDSIESVSKSLGAISALATCGMNVTQGAVTLYKNTNCAIADLKALHVQTADIRAQAQRANQNSKEAERQYGAACERPIRDAAITESIGLGVARPLTDCSECCGGTKFKTPGYETCSEKWKTCMLACAEQFGQNDPRFFYSNSAVVDYRGAKCDDAPAVDNSVEKVRCCKTCRMPQRYNFGWTDCRDVWLCSAETSARDLGVNSVVGSTDARDQCERKYDLDDHRMQVDTAACKFVPKGQCEEVGHPDWGM